MYELDTLGFGPYFEAQLHGGEEIVARIAGEHRQGYLVWTPDGEGFARVAGRLAREFDDEDYPAVGDWVTLKTAPASGHTAIIDRVLVRRTVFTRGAVGNGARTQVIAANVDIVFVVCGLDADYNLHRIQRYVARVHASGAQPTVILNKADVCGVVATCVADVNRATPGVPVLVTAAVMGTGVEQVVAHLRPGVTSAFVGSSGAGKSTLINALLGEDRLRTGATRTSDGRGRHTTTRREMLQFPSGGLLIDTPGMRELALLDEAGLGDVFVGVEELAARCRFRDCTHRSEPGCALRGAVERGEVTVDQVQHYLKLVAEARAFELRHDERERRRQERSVGKRMASDLKLIYRVKEGR